MSDVATGILGFKTRSVFDIVINKSETDQFFFFLNETIPSYNISGIKSLDANRTQITIVVDDGSWYAVIDKYFEGGE